MDRVYRYLTADDVTQIKAEVMAPDAPMIPDASLLRAWEADLAAHEALRDSKQGDARKPHEDAIVALETALACLAPPAAALKRS